MAMVGCSILWFVHGGTVYFQTLPLWNFHFKHFSFCSLRGSGCELLQTILYSAAWPATCRSQQHLWQLALQLRRLSPMRPELLAAAAPMRADLAQLKDDRKLLKQTLKQVSKSIKNEDPGCTATLDFRFQLRLMDAFIPFWNSLPSSIKRHSS